MLSFKSWLPYGFPVVLNDSAERQMLLSTRDVAFIFLVENFEMHCSLLKQNKQTACAHIELSPHKKNDYTSVQCTVYCFFFFLYHLYTSVRKYVSLRSHDSLQSRTLAPHFGHECQMFHNTFHAEHAMKLLVQWPTKRTQLGHISRRFCLEEVQKFRKWGTTFISC